MKLSSYENKALLKKLQGHCVSSGTKCFYQQDELVAASYNLYDLMGHGHGEIVGEACKNLN